MTAPQRTLFLLLLAAPPSLRADGLAGVPPDSSAATPVADSIAVKVTFPVVEVKGSYEGSLAPRFASSQGLVTPRQLALRPALRAGDLLESVPGVLISQHSGEGKANQYYLRGFNLDHGTDFATTIAGVPVNMPTHAHGQGYTDLNFAIPELVGGIQYLKGTYSVEDGDFASAGSARISYRNTLPAPLVSFTSGGEGYRRLLVGLSPRLRLGNLLGALEWIRNEGPWTEPDDFRKVNGILRYGRGTAERGWSVSAMGYDARWNSTDQIPRRAIESGAISRFDTLDPTDGGTTHRYSLSAEYQDLAPQSVFKASAYVLAYQLDLFSNFTYFLDNPVEGDQFEQADERVVTGLRMSYRTGDAAFQRSIGVDLRHDNIANVGLYHTQARHRIATTREDHVLESSLSPFVQADMRWTPMLRTILGVRAEGYRFGVESSHAPFTGSGLTGLVSPKASLILGPWGPVELYLNGGYGFHSHDARGARFSSASAPASTPTVAMHLPIPGGAPVERAPLLVRTKGAEVGARLLGASLGSLAATLWGLDIASETVFVGDAGLTEPSRPSRRLGLEVTAAFRPLPGVDFDADAAYSRARFRDQDPAGDRIPGAVEGVLSAGVEFQHPAGEFAGLRLRYFGPRPLIEDNRVRSPTSAVLNAKVGHRARGRWTIALEVFNLLDRRVSDVDYFYASRLPGEPAEGVDDIHTHPQEPRSFRLVLSMGEPR